MAFIDQIEKLEEQVRTLRAEVKRRTAQLAERTWEMDSWKAQVNLLHEGQNRLEKERDDARARMTALEEAGDVIVEDIQHYQYIDLHRQQWRQVRGERL